MKRQGGSARKVEYGPTTFAAKSSAAEICMTLDVDIIECFRDPKHQERAPRPTAALDAWKKFRHVGSRIAVGSASLQLIEDHLQLVAAGDNHADGDYSQVKQQSEIVEIAVKERILVVPFDLKSDTILEAINLMRWRVQGRSIHKDSGVEVLWYPSLVRQLAIDPVGYG